MIPAAAVDGKQQLWLQGYACAPRRADPLDGRRFFSVLVFQTVTTLPFRRWQAEEGRSRRADPSSLSATVSSRGGSWSRDNVIIFSLNNSSVSIQSVPAMGGVPVDVIQTKGNQRFPVFLPDGRHFLYLRRDDEKGIFVSSLDGTENRRVLSDVSGAIFATSAQPDSPGNLLFVRGTALMAVPFDPVTAQVTGQVFPVADGVALATPSSYLPASVSVDGALLYATGGNSATQINQIGWYDRSGKLLSLVSSPGAVYKPRALSGREIGAALTRQWQRRRHLVARSKSRNRIPGYYRFLLQCHSVLVAQRRSHRLCIESYRRLQHVLEGPQQRPARTASASEHAHRHPHLQWALRDSRFIIYFELDPTTNARHLGAPCRRRHAGSEAGLIPAIRVRRALRPALARWALDGFYLGSVRASRSLRTAVPVRRQ